MAMEVEYETLDDQLGYDADHSDPSQYCKHGTWIGSFWGPDYMCQWCEDGTDPCDACGSSVGGYGQDYKDEDRGFCILPIEGKTLCDRCLEVEHRRPGTLAERPQIVCDVLIDLAFIEHELLEIAKLNELPVSSACGPFLRTNYQRINGGALNALGHLTAPADEVLQHVEEMSPDDAIMVDRMANIGRAKGAILMIRR